MKHLLASNLASRGARCLTATFLGLSSLFIPFEVSAQEPSQSVVQISNQAEPGTGFFLQVGGKIILITAKHVIGSSGESVSLRLSGGGSIKVPLQNQIPVTGLDATVVLIEGPLEIIPLSVAEKKPDSSSLLTVWGFPVSANSTSSPLTSRKGSYLGSPAELSDGYSLLYGAQTQIGFSGGPILDDQGNVVGMHGRSESRRSSSGENIRTGNALGIPVNSIISSILKSTGSASVAIDEKALQDQAAAASMTKVTEIFSQSSFSDQVLAELERASLGRVPSYCIEMAHAYYYTFFSAVPNLSKASSSFLISKKQDGIDPVYYALASLVAQKSADYARKLQYDRILEKMNQSSYLQYSERRLQGEVQSALNRCKPTA
jgi:S1-C subfamily serine protease